MAEHQNTYLILYLYQMATVTIQELSQSRNLLYFIPAQKASVTLFPLLY